MTPHHDTPARALDVVVLPEPSSIAAHATGAHVVLVGLPGAGRSTVGPFVARARARAFVDLDAELERRTGRTIAEQFASDGESAFRMEEATLSAELATVGAAVLAAGGGWVANAPARAALARRVRTVYLRVPLAVAAARIAGEPGRRPLVGDVGNSIEAVKQLLAEREHLYEASHAVVDAAPGAPEVVAERVVVAVRTWGAADV